MSYSNYAYSNQTVADANEYIRNVLKKYLIPVGPNSPAEIGAQAMVPTITQWAGTCLLAIKYSGSYAKGTGVAGSTDVDLFISLHESTSGTLAELYNSLFNWLRERSYSVRKQNVSIGVTYGGVSIDLVPGRKWQGWTTDHSIYRSKAASWTKTNIDTQIAHVRGFQMTDEIRAVKLWRNLNGLEFPSFYLELSVIEALTGFSGTLSQRVFKVLTYLRDSFETKSIYDPANASNCISDDLTKDEKRRVAAAASKACACQYWSQIIW